MEGIDNKTSLDGISKVQQNGKYNKYNAYKLYYYRKKGYTYDQIVDLYKKKYGVAVSRFTVSKRFRDIDNNNALENVEKRLIRSMIKFENNNLQYMVEHCKKDLYLRFKLYDSENLETNRK